MLLFFLVLLCPPLLSLSGPSSLSLRCWRWLRQWSHFPLVFHQFFFVLRLRSGDESKGGNAGFLLFPFLSLCFRSSLSRYPWFVPFCSSLCFVLWSLSIYSLSIPLFIFLRPCSLRRNKENNLLFWFVLCLRFLPFVAFSSPIPCRFSFSGFYNQRMPCGRMDFNAIKASVFFFFFSSEEDEQC